MQPQSTTLGVSKRAAIYIRVSTEEQEENSSLESQRLACERLADEQGYVVAALYRDVQSGASLERKQLSALLRAIERKEIDVVICYSPDRLSRDIDDRAFLRVLAKRAGVKLEYVTNPTDDSIESQIVEQVLGITAKVEHRDIVRRTQSGIRARVDAGNYLPGGRPPYGYHFVDPVAVEVGGKRLPAKTRLESDQGTAPVVERMFAYVAAGQSVNSLAQQLTSERIPTPTEYANGLSAGSKPWERSTLRAILRNPLYKGEPQAYRYKVAKPSRAKVKVPLEPITEPVSLKDVAPALVSPELWRKANDQLDRNRRELSSQKATPEDTLLRAGYAICGYCGRPMIVNRSSGGKARGAVIYRCNTPIADHGGRGVSIRAHILDTAVWGKVMDVLTDPSYVKQYMQEWLAGKDTTADELAHIEAELATIATKEQRLAAQLAALTDAAPVVDMLNDLAERKRLLMLQQNNLSMRRGQYESTLERWETMLARWEWAGFENYPKLKDMSYQDRRFWLANLNVNAEIWREGEGPEGQRYRITMAIDESFWLPTEDELTGDWLNDYSELRLSSGGRGAVSGSPCSPASSSGCGAAPTPGPRSA